MPTEAELINSIRQGVGELQYVELNEDDRDVLARIDRQVWDLVEDVNEERAKEEV